MLNKDNPTLKEEDNSMLKELDVIFKDIKSRLSKVTFMGKNIADKFAPIEDILIFVGRVVEKVEQIEKENEFLKKELDKVNEELGQQSTRLNKCEKVI